MEPTAHQPVVFETLRKITAEEFGSMLAAAVFDEERERVELIDGLMYSVTRAESPGHRLTIARLNRLLTTQFPEPSIVQPQQKLFLGRFDVPQPDYVVYHSSDAFTPYVDPGQVALVIEVAESSLSKDRALKAPLFARYGLGEYWIVNVKRREVEVYAEPHEGDYRVKRTFATHEPIVSAAVPGPPIAPAEFVLE